MSKKPLTIWFEQNGDLSEHSVVAHLAAQYGYKSEEAKDFDDQMEYLNLSEFRRRSGRVYFKSVTTGRKYSMYLDDFNAIIKANRFNDKKIEGTFHFVKRSSGQAIQLVLPKDKT
ncbi:MAG: hypothetical protein HC880_21315 [Bacteroidia bacterium]|nr:hypothetical protein [Bacteroidia bacterium]